MKNVAATAALLAAVVLADLTFWAVFDFVTK